MKVLYEAINVLDHKGWKESEVLVMHSRRLFPIIFGYLSGTKIEV